MSAAAKVPNLRKRKAVPGAFREPSKSPGPEEEEEEEEEEEVVEEPPQKKVKSKPVDSPRPSPITEKDSLDPAPSCRVERGQNLSLVSSPEGTLHENVAGTVDQEGLGLEDASQPRMSTRKGKGVGSQTCSTCSRSSSLSRGEGRAPHSHSRTRSISYTSSQTAVVSNHRRSASVLSATTVVGGRGCMKRKQASGDSKEHSEDDDEGMVTRGRASRARVDAVKMVAEEKTRGGKQGSMPKVKRKP